MMVPSQMQTPQSTMGTGNASYNQMGPSAIPQSTYLQNMPSNPQQLQQLRQQQQQQRLMAMKRQSMSNPGQQPQSAALMAQIQQQIGPNQYGNYNNQQRF